MRAVDTAALLEAKAIFTNSKVVSDRLKRYNNVASTVLYPPIFKSERFHCRSFNDEIVYICRMEHHKRQHLLIDAMRYTKTPVKLRLCGSSSGPDYSQELTRTIVQAGLHDRVVLEDRWISEEEKVEYLADCLAAAYLPVDEDSYGYPSLEASHAAKPVISTLDSGGVLELVEHGVNGLITAPEPQALAEAMDQLYINREATQRMGRNARARLDDLAINWPHVLESLLA